MPNLQQICVVFQPYKARQELQGSTKGYQVGVNTHTRQDRKICEAKNVADNWNGVRAIYPILFYTKIILSNAILPDLSYYPMPTLFYPIVTVT